MRASTLAAAVVATVALASPASAQRGPYVQLGTPSEVTVVWRTLLPARGTVCYGTRADALDSTVSGASGRTQHEIRVTGLEPDTRYFYAATTGSCPSRAEPGRWFDTAPPVGSSAPFRVWVVGDSGTGGLPQMRVRDAMLDWVGAEPPDIYLHMGDMAYSDGEDLEFELKFFAIYQSILQNTVCWPTMGNHEGHTSDSADESGPYYDAYVLPRDGRAGGAASGTEAYYSFDHANVHFVVLDSYESPREVGGAMLRWLEEDLMGTDQDWIVAYFHHPPYTKGSHDSDTESSHIDMRENALPILESFGVDLVLGGHSHIYERSYLLSGAYDTPTTAEGHVVDMGDGRPDGDGAYDTTGDGTLFVTAGHGGTSVRQDAEHPVMYFAEPENGSVIIDVDGGTMTLTNLRHDGEVTDWVTLVKGEGLYLLSPLGGERFLAGSDVDIRWNTVGTATTAVRIEVSLDGGARFTPVVDRTDDDGHHVWTSPPVRTDMAVIRITDADDAATTDRSGAFSLTDTTTVELVPWGSVWEYQDTLDAAPPAGWQTSLGDGWPAGEAQLGYGDGDESTVLTDEDPNIPTVYFRRGFALAGEIVDASVSVLYDDGVAVYVNGDEVLSADLLLGTAHPLYATGGSDDNERMTVRLGPGAFTDGDNVVAALVKQRDEGSSDLSFDLQITATVRVELPDPPPDAGPPAGVDAGPLPPGVDAGPLPPGVDAGPLPPGVDGGPGGGGDGGGCGCRAAGAGDAGVGLAALALLAWRRRRRSGS